MHKLFTRISNDKHMLKLLNLYLYEPMYLYVETVVETWTTVFIS